MSEWKEIGWHEYPKWSPGERACSVLVSVGGTTHAAVWQPRNKKFIPFDRDLAIPEDMITWWAVMPKAPDWDGYCWIV